MKTMSKIEKVESLKNRHQEDSRGYLVFYDRNNTTVGHFAVTKRGYARGGNINPFDKTVFVLDGVLLSVSIGPQSEFYAVGVEKPAAYYIPAGFANMVYAVRDSKHLAIYTKTGESKPFPPLKEIVELTMRKGPVATNIITDLLLEKFEQNMVGLLLEKNPAV
jgi:hypothetical protein